MAITRVNSASISATGTSASGYSATIPNGTGISAGDLIIVCGNSNGTHAANGMSCLDSVNSINYTTIKEQQLSNASSRWLQTFLFQTSVAVADGSTITFTPYAANTASGFCVDIFRGTNGTISNAVVGVSPSPSTTCACPALAAAPAAGNLVLSFVAFSTTATSLTVASPFTKGSSDGNNTPSVSIGYVLSADGSSTYGVTWTNDSSQSSAGETVAFGQAAVVLQQVSVTTLSLGTPVRMREFFHWTM